jgi:hypothetical protein
MKPTKTLVLAFVRQQLSLSPVWAVKALVRIFQENQTASEQAAGVTEVDNGIGFTGCDAAFLSSLAQGYLRYGRLSDKQLAFVLRKMPKYAKQVVAMADAAKLEAQALAYEERRNVEACAAGAA